MDPTIWVAIIAIVAPVVTTLINNRYLYKMKKVDDALSHSREIEKHMRGVYCDYLESASMCITYPSEETMKEYGRCYAISYAYFPPKAHDMLKRVNESIRSNDFDEANQTLENLSIWISDLMKHEINGIAKNRDN